MVKSYRLFFKRCSLPYPPNQLRSFTCSFAVSLRLNDRGFLTLWTFVYLIHLGWCLRVAFISAVLRRWGSPKQWWAGTGRELPWFLLSCCALWFMFFPFEISPLSSLPVDQTAEMEVVGIALWVFCLSSGPKDCGQKDSLPWNILQMILPSSNNILWIHFP